jgi:hypothetical protein
LPLIRHRRLKYQQPEEEITMDQSAASPIVVGIDGSKHAIGAAIWATDEAVSRGAQLLLVCVIDPDSQDLDRE